MQKTSFTNPEPMAPLPRHERSERTLLGLTHALDALEFLARERRDVPLAEIAEALDMSKAGAHRVLSTLLERRYVDRHHGGRYRLGIGTWELGRQVVDLDLVTVAAPFMEDLAAGTHESVQLGTRSGFDVVYLHVVAPTQAVRVHVDVGDRRPANWSSTGLVLLAHLTVDEQSAVLPPKMTALTRFTIADAGALKLELARIRARGYAVGLGIWREDVIGVSAPVFAPNGRVIAALNLAGPRYRISRSKLAELRDATIRAAGAISEALGRGRLAAHPQPKTAA